MGKQDYCQNEGCGMPFFHCECGLKGKKFKINNMKTGIELIAIERQEQIEKHGRTIENDLISNDYGQLKKAAIILI